MSEMENPSKQFFKDIQTLKLSQEKWEARLSDAGFCNMLDCISHENGDSIYHYLLGKVKLDVSESGLEKIHDTEVIIALLMEHNINPLRLNKRAQTPSVAAKTVSESLAIRLADYETAYRIRAEKEFYGAD